MNPAMCPPVADPLGLTVTTDPDGHSTVYHLGYRLPLSPAESRLLLCLIRGGGREISMTELSLATGEHHAVSETEVSVLVGRINRKAAAIGGRSLIRGRSHHGFTLALEA